MAEKESLSESLVKSSIRVLLRVVFVFLTLGADCNYVIDKSAVAQIQGNGHNWSTVAKRKNKEL